MFGLPQASVPRALYTPTGCHHWIANHHEFGLIRERVQELVNDGVPGILVQDVDGHHLEWTMLVFDTRGNWCSMSVHGTHFIEEGDLVECVRHRGDAFFCYKIARFVLHGDPCDEDDEGLPWTPPPPRDNILDPVEFQKGCQRLLGRSLNDEDAISSLVRLCKKNPHTLEVMKRLPEWRETVGAAAHDANAVFRVMGGLLAEM